MSLSYTDYILFLLFLVDNSQSLTKEALMVLGKSSSKYSASNASTSFLPSTNSLWYEVARLLWLAAAIHSFLCLISYSPLDPSWSTWSSRGNFANWMGRTGSIVADLLYQLWGIAAFVIPSLLLTIAIRKHQPTKDQRTARATLLVALLFVGSVGTLFQSSLPQRWMPFRLQNPGGLIGQMLLATLRYLSGSAGGTLLAVIFFLTMSILLFRWKIVTATIEFLSTNIPLFFSKVKTFPGVLFRRIRALWEPNLREAVEPKPETISIPLPESRPVLTREQLSLPLSERDERIELNASPKEDEELSKFNAPRLFRRDKSDRRPTPSKGNKDFQLPALSLLSGKAESKTKPVDKNWYLEKGQILVQKLRDFGVEGEVVNISPGPVITVYEFKPASGVKIKEIANLSDDLTLALSVLSVRIVAPIPGKPVVGIEIPSPHREMVFFKDLIQETPFYDSDVRIPIVMGRLASGEPVVAGLASMPHLLVAGSTGTGKSVFINTLICSLLYRYTPQQLKLILVDPKMVELAAYENIPHLLLPVVVDSKKAALALRWAVEEMERRYTLMHQLAARHIDAYNEKANDPNTPAEHTFLPYIVVVIDEYADLMAVVPKDVELSIARLAQKARASGIHLVLATQRPSTDVVTGTIKANFPSRISFRVASSVDSKTILDRTGADRLLGNGDLLFHSAGFSTLKRMQGAYISDVDLEHITDFLRTQGEPEYDQRILDQTQNVEDGDLREGDGEADEGELYDRAVRLVADKGEASISLIQRHLKIGYNRAATLMEQMEKEGVVAQATGASKRRAVLVNS